MEADGWSAERTADGIADLLNSDNTQFIKNWSKKKNASEYGAFLPYDIDPIFSPFDVFRKRTSLRTVFSPPQVRMQKLGYGAGGGKSLISRFRDPKIAHAYDGTPGTQLQPISVVGPQPVMSNPIAEALEKARALKGKKAIIPPAVASMGILDAMTPTEAQGRAQTPHPYTGKPDLPLEEPAWSPVDMMLAPIGVAGTGAKLAWAAATPFVNSAVDGILGWFGRE